jgi:flagellar hook protein FlgE
MTLFSALNAAVTGLRAQSAAISVSSENIANVSTTAYKTRDLAFTSLVTGGSARVPTGGVLYSSFQNINTQGLIQASQTNTNVAINGGGFFVVADTPTSTAVGLNYSRNGSFAQNANGNLVNSEGYFLYGYPTDGDGNVLAINSNDLASLQAIDTSAVSGSARSTSLVQISANLPADGTGPYQFGFEIFDELGVSQTVVATATRNATINEWDITLANPVLTSDLSGPATAVIAPNNFTLTFNGDGTFGSIVPATNPIAITGFTTGSNDISINLDIGTAGLTNGLTQFSSSSTNPDIEINSIEQDGLRFGRLTQIQIDNAGLVTALFDNGLRQAFYQIPIATFSNPGGLFNVEGLVYDENQAGAGNVLLNLPGIGSAGTVNASSLELSTTDTSEEFNRIIVAQQGYSSSAQVISTADDLFDALLRAVA